MPGSLDNRVKDSKKENRLGEGAPLDGAGNTKFVGESNPASPKLKTR